MFCLFSVVSLSSLVFLRVIESEWSGDGGWVNASGDFSDG